MWLGVERIFAGIKLVSCAVRSVTGLRGMVFSPMILGATLR